MHFVGLFLSLLLKMHGPENKQKNYPLCPCACFPYCTVTSFYLLFNRYRDSIAGDKSVRAWSWPPPSSAKAANEWSYTSTPPMCLHGVDRDNCAFTAIQSAIWLNRLAVDRRRSLFVLNFNSDDVFGRMFPINIANLNINVHGVTCRKTVGLTLIYAVLEPRTT